MSNEIIKSAISAVLPPGNIWQPADGLDLDLLFDGIADSAEIIRSFLDELSKIRNPNLTLYLEDLEREWGIVTDITLTESVRREKLTALVYARNGGGTAEFLKDTLRRSGFDVFVNENSPAVDPAIYLDQSFQMVSGAGNAYAGRADAFAGRLGGELLVNGPIIDFGPIYLSSASLMYAGQSKAVAGFFDESEFTEFSYDIPIDFNKWPFIFFVSGGKIGIPYSGDFFTTTFGQNIFIAAGKEGEVQRSTDGEVWTHDKVGSDSSIFGSSAFGNGSFIMGGNDAELFTSVNGKDWIQRTLDGGYSDTVTGIIYGNSIFVMVGRSGEIQTSSDAITWTQRTAAGGFSGSFFDIVYDNGLFVAVGQSGEIQTSPDAITWTQRTAAGGYSSSFLDVTYGNGLFLAVGVNAEIQTSPDGITWTHRTAAGAFAGGFKASIFFKGLFIIAGDSAEIQTSPDGITWTHRTAAGSFLGNFSDFSFNDNKVILVANFATIQISNDGIDWQNSDVADSSFNLLRAEIPIEREQDFKRTILKIKPLHSWAALIVTYV